MIVLIEDCNDLRQRGPNTGMRAADSYCAAPERFLYKIYYTKS